MHGDHLPEDRWNPFDERHVAGAFRDNREIPFEGACVKDFTLEQRKAIVESVENFIEYLPAGPLKYRLKQVEEYLDESEHRAKSFRYTQLITPPGIQRTLSGMVASAMRIRTTTASIRQSLSWSLTSIAVYVSN